jgi:hypothetical protein
MASVAPTPPSSQLPSAFKGTTCRRTIVHNEHEGDQSLGKGHRRIGLENIDVETLAVEHAFADDEPPADIDVERQRLAQQDRRRNYGNDREPGRHGAKSSIGGLGGR